MSSIEKAIWILKRLAEPPYSMSLSSISKELGMGRSGSHKILASLKEGNLIVQDESTKHYRLGIAMYRMGNEFSKRLGVWDVAEPIMRELLTETKETVSIGVVEGDTPFLAYRIMDSAYSHLSLSLGAKYPLHASAIGKCLAAYMDEQHLRELITKAQLVSFTGRTIVDSEVLFEEYRRIRQQGYAVSIEEHIEGESAVAAPIRSANGRISFSLGVGGYVRTFNHERLKESIPMVMLAAKRIAEKISYKGI